MDFQDRFFLANEFFTGRFTGPVTFFSYFLCGFNLGSNQFLQNLLTRTKLTYPIAPPLLHFYIDSLGKDKSFADLIKGAWDVHKRFDGNWKKFSKKISMKIQSRFGHVSLDTIIIAKGFFLLIWLLFQRLWRYFGNFTVIFKICSDSAEDGHFVSFF